MFTVLAVICAVAAIGGMVLILRNFRKQADISEGPGIVPEDYD